MFRQEEILMGGWSDKTPEAMQKRRFEHSVKQLGPLGANRLEALSPDALERRLEQSWQDVKRKPMHHQQLTQVWKHVLETIDVQADCLSREEHELVERAIVLGGTARIEDAVELEAARALSLRLWASIGVIGDKPYIELEKTVRQPAARAFSRNEHEAIRARLNDFHEYLTGTLYRVGALDDRQPQKMILRDILCVDEQDEVFSQLARRYLWASYDCMDYNGGVMLIHPALADPQSVIRGKRNLGGILMMPSSAVCYTDILPEEIPLQKELECAIAGCASRRPQGGGCCDNAASAVQAGRTAQRIGRSFAGFFDRLCIRFDACGAFRSLYSNAQMGCPRAQRYAAINQRGESTCNSL